MLVDVDARHFTNTPQHVTILGRIEVYFKDGSICVKLFTFGCILRKRRLFWWLQTQNNFFKAAGR